MKTEGTEASKSKTYQNVFPIGTLFRLCVQQLYEVLKTLELRTSEKNLNKGDAYWIMQSTSTLEYDGSSHL